MACQISKTSSFNTPSTRNQINFVFSNQVTEQPNKLETLEQLKNAYFQKI